MAAWSVTRSWMPFCQVLVLKGCAEAVLGLLAGCQLHRFSSRLIEVLGFGKAFGVLQSHAFCKAEASSFYSWRKLSWQTEVKCPKLLMKSEL